MKKIMKSLLFITILCLISSSFLNAAAKYDTGSIDSYLKEIQRKTPVPGFAVVVVADQRIIFTKGYGVEKVGSPKPMTENSPSAIGSLTKSFTALAVMQLVEEEKLKLDDPVIKYLPWFKTADEELSRKITVRMLLTNTSGLPETNIINRIDGSDQAMEQGVRDLSARPLKRTPGIAFDYSNEGFDTLGVIIAKVSGIRYQDYIQRKILQPLKMDHSTSDWARFDRLQVLYGHNPGIDTAIPAAENFNALALAAGSELRCSAENLGHYLIAWLGSGRYEGNSIISAASIQQMWRPAVTLQGGITEMGGDLETLHYGFGWFISKIDGREMIHHPGGTLTMSSYTMIDPEKGQAISMILNIGTMDPYRYSSPLTVVNNLFHLLNHEPLTNFGVRKEQDPYGKATDLPLSLQEKYRGEYASAAGDAMMEISAGNHHDLIAQVHFTTGTSVFQMKFNSPTDAILKSIGWDCPATFRMTADGAVTGLDSAFGGTLTKLPSERHAKFQWFAAPAKELSFYLPKNYRIKWSGRQFQAQSPDGRIILTGGARKKDQDGLNGLAPLILNSASNIRVIHDGSIKKENIAARLWSEKSLWIREKGQIRQMVIVYLEDGETAYWMVMNTPGGEATTAIREVLVPLMRDFKIMNS